MIGDMDLQANIRLYLDETDLLRLLLSPTNTAEGVLINAESPKRQGTFCVYLKTMHRDRQDFEREIVVQPPFGTGDRLHLDVFMGYEAYRELQEN